ncbi:MAG: YggS family pyridoxal phosphate-dependent enzyme [Desulfovibrio sp.]|nr:YggS family pyridoxal phosphate-dependent enzyme [Desulfovibrio sp.]
MNAQSPPEIKRRYESVLERLDAACSAAGRPRKGVKLVAVSKQCPAQAVSVIAAAGQVDFGESYVQEAVKKREELSGDPACENIRWHMIGHVQSRKVADVAGAYALLHTLDSRKLAAALERRLTALGARQAVLLQINIADEPQKSGAAPGDLLVLTDYIMNECPHLELGGLMCLPPVFDAGEAARPHFARLYALRESLRSRLNLALPELSMGMSGDFAAAVAEGATLVRIGTDIFGERQSKH